MFEGLFQPMHLLILLFISVFSFIIPVIINIIMVCKVWQISQSASRISTTLEQLAFTYRAKNPS